MCEVKDNAAGLLSKDLTNAVKGIAAVAVLLHHCYQRTYFVAQPLIGKALELLGYLAVAVFFFLSGYGLMASYARKREAYITLFPRKRLLPFYGTYLLFVAITLIENYLIGVPLDWPTVITSFLLGGTIVTYGWYLQTVLLFYILFYLIFRYGKREQQKVLTLAMCVLLYVLVSHACRAASATYISALAFVAGILWGGFPACCAAVMQKRRLALGVCGLIFLLLLAISLLSENRHLRYIPRALSAPFFALSMAMMLSLIHEKRGSVLVNRATAWLGKYSLEIYVAQGLFFQLLRSNLLYVHNAYLYMGAVIVCTMLSAPLLYGLVRGVYAVWSE